MKQQDLFGAPTDDKYPNAPGWTEPTTSKAAAEAIKPHVSKQQKRILDFLIERGDHGATYTEISDGTGVYAQSVCGRMVELVSKKLVVKTETTRKTPSGTDAKVYRAVPQ